MTSWFLNNSYFASEVASSIRAEPGSPTPHRLNRPTRIDRGANRLFRIDRRLHHAADGTFEIRDVAPGAYWLRAMVNDGSADSLLPRSAAGRPVTEVLIDSLFSNRRAAQVPLDVTTSTGWR